MGQQKQKCAVTNVESESTEKRKIVPGSVWDSNNYGKFKVLAWDGYKDITIEFLDTGFITKTRSESIASGSVKDKLKRSVFGFGYIGDGEFSTKDKKAYSRWSGILKRCYSDDYQIKKPTYKGCTVCDDWLNFQNFAEWFYLNYPDDGDDYQIDKDLKVIGNKIYSPKTCMFVSSVVNSFTSDHGGARGELLIGACATKSPFLFSASCCNPFTGKQEQYRGFRSEIDAHMAWRSRKAEIAYELAMMQKSKDAMDSILRWRMLLIENKIHTVTRVTE